MLRCLYSPGWDKEGADKVGSFHVIVQTRIIYDIMTRVRRNKCIKLKEPSTNVQRIVRVLYLCVLLCGLSGCLVQLDSLYRCGQEQPAVGNPFCNHGVKVVHRRSCRETLQWSTRGWKVLSMMDGSFVRQPPRRSPMNISIRWSSLFSFFQRLKKKKSSELKISR